MDIEYELHVLIQMALRCILEALDNCHRKGWALNNLRWANVIFLATGIWTIIDCEYARPIGDPLPQELIVKCDWSVDCSSSTDLYCVGRMLKDLDSLVQINDDLCQLQTTLLSKRQCFDKVLDVATVVQKFAWLRQASAAKPAGDDRQGGMLNKVLLIVLIIRLSTS